MKFILFIPLLFLFMVSQVSCQEREVHFNEFETVDSQNVIVVYGLDDQNYEKLSILSYIIVPGRISNEDKLKILVNYLSKMYFDGLEINIKEVKLINEKKIIILDLTNPEKGTRKWSDFTNGTTQSYDFELKIICSILQIYNNPNWFDGVVIEGYLGNRIIYKSEYPVPGRGLFF